MTAALTDRGCGMIGSWIDAVSKAIISLTARQANRQAMADEERSDLFAQYPFRSARHIEIRVRLAEGR
jgi:hypothetical protein